MLQPLDVTGKPPSKAELKELGRRCSTAYKILKDTDSEVRLPLFVEFSGSPKSGKSSIIQIVSHFFRRQKISVVHPIEGASMRTPQPLKDDWLAFNAWSGCYALQNILVDCFIDPPVDIVILDRGLFDLCSWMEFLSSGEQRITADDRQRIADFFLIDLWRRRENLVFLFTADYKTSLARENNSKLTTSSGSMMNRDKLGGLLNAYKSASEAHHPQFGSIYAVDTSFRNGKELSFQRIAFAVVDRIIELMHNLGTQSLLVTEDIEFEGFQTDEATVKRTREKILRKGMPLFVDRQEAEASTIVKQVVPYALLRNTDGQYFMARRRADLKRKELQRKLTLLVGGHAEKRDWSPEAPESVFENCLRRELEEELVGINIKSISPKGFVFAPDTPVGTLHLAYIFVVEVGGNVNVRRQAIDKEFGRERVEWVDDAVICNKVAELDPWSQLVAAKLFGATMPPSDANLFANNG